MKILLSTILMIVSMSVNASWSRDVSQPVTVSVSQNGESHQQKQGQKQQQQQRQTQDQRATARNEGNNNVNNWEPDNVAKTYQEFVAPAFAPPLAATGDCLGSASAGGSNSVMGFSLGSTYVDEDCNARRDSIHLHALGRTTAAVMRLCARPEMAKVLPECPQPEKTVYNGWDD